ncbi:MAG: tetratricopeptide repeat protein [Bernardetiaceae bacterium]|nr:tetratricopeptide repeat protein [Bernardetiaceae bacterium]
MLLGLLACGTLPVLAQSWSSLFTQGQQALEKKDHPGAATLLEQALSAAEKEFTAQHPNYVKTLYALAETYKALNEPKKERNCYLALINIKRDLKQERTVEFAKLLFNTALSYLQTKEYANADNYFNQSLALQRSLKQEETVDFVVTQHEYARLFKSTNRLDKAASYYVPAFEQGAKLLGNKNPRLAEMASEMADLYAKMKNYSKANEFYLKWIELCKVQQIPEGQYYTAYYQLHVNHKSLNQPAESIRYGNAYVESVKKYNSDKLVEELDKVVKNFKEMNAYQAAAVLLPIKADALKTSYGEQSMEYGTAIGELATVEFHAGQQQKAIADLQKGIEIVNQSKKKPEHEATLVELMAQLASYLRQTGDKENTETALHNTIEHAKKINDKQLLYARAIDSLAFYYHSTGQTAKADSLFKLNIEVRRKNLTDKHPDYAMSLSNYADFLLAQGKPEIAESLLKQANAIDGAYYGRGSIEFTRSMLKLADLAALRKNYPEALRLYRSILENQRKLQGEQSPDYQATLKKINELTAQMSKK